MKKVQKYGNFATLDAIRAMIESDECNEIVFEEEWETGIPDGDDGESAGVWEYAIEYFIYFDPDEKPDLWFIAIRKAEDGKFYIDRQSEVEY